MRALEGPGADQKLEERFSVKARRPSSAALDEEALSASA